MWGPSNGLLGTVVEQVTVSLEKATVISIHRVENTVEARQRQIFAPKNIDFSVLCVCRSLCTSEYMACTSEYMR